MNTGPITIEKEGNTFKASPDPYTTQRGQTLKFDATNANVRITFDNPPDRRWLIPPIPDHVDINQGQSKQFEVNPNQQFPQGQDKVNIAYTISAAGASAQAGADPLIIIEEC